MVGTPHPPMRRTSFVQSTSSKCSNVDVPSKFFVTVAKGTTAVLLAITSVSAWSGIAMAREERKGVAHLGAVVRVR
jgi:hypothetical protein